MSLYFAYGSNMSPEQMGRRCPAARRIGIGRLRHFRMVFNRQGTRHPGAVAGVEPGRHDRDVVLGVVWELADADLLRMDEIENPAAYARITVPVEIDGEAPRYCWTYVSYPDDRNLAPDQSYVQRVIDAATTAGLPADYIDDLSRWLPPQPPA